jgi:hypothetical protein
VAQKRIAYDGTLYDISYEIINPVASKDIVFLHGWGSNKILMKGVFQDTFKKFRHIYIDMPGFGASLNPNVLYTSDYAAILELFLKELNFSGDIVLGHSFGGKVATLLHPKLLVLVASSGILVPKPLSVKIKIALFKLLKNIGLQKFRTLFVSDDAASLSLNMYETFKNVVNEDFSSAFASFKGKALLCFAKNDTATPLYTAHKIEALMDDARIAVFEGDHYFFMKEKLHVEAEVLQSLQAMER